MLPERASRITRDEKKRVDSRPGRGSTALRLIGSAAEAPPQTKF
jgi:hypothetical protein